MTTIAERTWREAEAEALETKAEAIEGSLLGLQGLEGMFSDREELRVTCANTRDLLRIEVENLRTAAMRVRGETPERKNKGQGPIALVVRDAEATG